MLGAWDNPYKTMNFANEANEIRALRQIMERGFVYRGLKPVYWCFDCGSSLAEFEIEYADKKSQAIDVAFRCAEPDKLAAIFGLATLDEPAYVLIWTTTAWTIPANQALNVNPELDYALVHTERGYLLLASSLVSQCLERYGLQGELVGTAKGRALEALRFEHPLHDVDAGYRRTAPVYLADYATDADGTGIVHAAPAYGLDDFQSCVSHGLAYDEILNPVTGNGTYEAGFPLFGGQHIWKAVPVIIDTLKQAGRLFAEHTITHSYPHCWRHKTPVIYRAAAQWFVRMDEGEGVFTTDKPARSLRETAIVSDIEQALEAVQSLDEDQILRRFVNLVKAAVRTNFYQMAGDGAKPVVSIKFESRKIEDLPAPKFVNDDPRHLAGVGAFAGGGGILRQARPDSRREILLVAAFYGRARKATAQFYPAMATHFEGVWPNAPILNEAERTPKSLCRFIRFQHGQPNLCGTSRSGPAFDRRVN